MPPIASCTILYPSLTSVLLQALKRRLTALLLQVTRVVADECLAFQEQMRGGVLGEGHSWVADPGSGPASGKAEAEAKGPVRPLPQQGHVTVHSGLARRIANAVEDMHDAIATRKCVKPS